MVNDPISQLLAGKSPEAVLRETALTSREIIVAIGHAGLEGRSSTRPALVQQKPAQPQLRDTVSERELGLLFPGADRRSLLALSAGLLLIHDFWEASHEAAQLADDLGEHHVSAYWHGIAHRREPDPGNAAYWFRRVGKHPIFPKLADFARDQCANYPGAGSNHRLIEGDFWNPFAMIELCGTARTGSEAESLALALQREEMRLLLGVSLDQVSGPET